MSQTDIYARVSCMAIRAAAAVPVSAELKASIAEHGVKVPILISPDHHILSGSDILFTCIELGLPDIPVLFVHQTEPWQIAAIALYEHIRQDTTNWQLLTKHIAIFHLGQTLNDPNWTQKQTAEFFAIDPSTVSVMWRVWQNLGHESIAQCATLSAAYTALCASQPSASSTADDALRAAATAILSRQQPLAPAPTGPLPSAPNPSDPPNVLHHSPKRTLRTI